MNVFCFLFQLPPTPSVETEWWKAMRNAIVDGRTDVRKSAATLRFRRFVMASRAPENQVHSAGKIGGGPLCPLVATPLLKPRLKLIHLIRCFVLVQFVCGFSNSFLSGVEWNKIHQKALNKLVLIDFTN